jgi:uncharacterized membrane protein YhaH (DUF805 family)
MFFLFNIIFAFVALGIDMLLGTTLGGQGGFGIIYLLYGLVMLIPGIAVAVRRLHDVGKSGWFILISLIPIIGGIWLLVLLVTDSESGDNEYGPNPKAVDNNPLSQPEGY